jgi:hypothetical protein
VSYPDDLKLRLAGWICQPHRREVQAQHAHESVEQRMEDLGRISTTPDGRESKQADKIVNAPLKALDLSHGLFGVDLHIRQPWKTW